ncbi:MAG: hypothetical protein V4632_24115 [Pseudomonadota bacterium]
MRFLIVSILLSMSLSARAASIGDFFGALTSRADVHERGGSMDETLERLSVDMNRRTPVMVDQETRLDKITAEPGLQLKYHYTLLTVQGSDVSTSDFHKLLAPRLKNQLCGSDVEKFLRQGVTVSYFYRSLDGRALGGAQFGPDSCPSKTG